MEGALPLLDTASFDDGVVEELNELIISSDHIDKLTAFQILVLEDEAHGIGHHVAGVLDLLFYLEGDSF